MNSGLVNKVVMVTGASGGIGSEIVRQFIAEGSKVIIHYHKNKSSAEALAKNLSPESVFICQADLTNEMDVKRLWADSEARLGPIEVLIANAGICLNYGTPIHEISLDSWNKTLAGNLTSVFLCIRAFFKGIENNKLQAPAGVVISSTAGIYGEAFNADYAATKGALASGFLLSLKNELVRLAPRGRINAVCPSWTASDMVKDLVEDKDHVQRVLQTVPLRKIGRPADVAASAVYLSSTALAGHITGQVITIAGGMEGRVLFKPGEIDLKNI
jgi:3-oxoacyl-[acyl-carrier protein] reductase